MSSTSLNSDRARLKEILSDRKSKIYFLGIGGVSTSSLAEYLHCRGYRVEGCDDVASERTERLLGLGIPVTQGNRRADLSGVDLLVYSLAVEGCEPLLRAERSGIPTADRAELLGVIMSEYRHRIAVCGSHGKSTTVAMLQELLTHVGEHPTVFSGAELSTGSPLLMGEGDYLVYEACEYRDSFLRMSPTVTVATNIELDHTDYFADEEAIADSFLRALSMGDRRAISVDDPISRSLLPSLPDALTYGKGEGAALLLSDVRCTRRGIGLSLCYLGERLRLELPRPLPHDAMNAAAAISALLMLGFPPSAIEGGLSDFRGPSRRCELLRYIYSRAVYYDYAHHPTEIASTLSALRDRHGAVTVIFRPHTYTRTRDLWDGFVRALSLADRLVVVDIFPAREEAIEGVCSRRLAEEAGGVYLPERLAAEYAVESCRGAIVLMGAGDVDGIKRELLAY